MRLKNSTYNYGTPAKAFHWIAAILVLAMLALGFYMQAMALGTQKLQAYDLHKSLGVAVLALFIARLCWRFYTQAPKSLPTLSKIEILGAKAVHLFLYAALIAMPLSGWLMSSAAGRPVAFFGLFTLPDLIESSQQSAAFFRGLHGWLAWGIIVALVLHIAGAMKHFLIDRDKTLQRMLPFGRAPE